MPFLMSDVAAGSNAALQLQQNMGAAPLAQDVGRAQAEQVIANAEKTKLSNLVMDTGIKADAEIKSKVQGLIKNPDYLKADASDQQRKLAALYMEAGKVEDGAKILSNAEITSAKELVNKQKAMDIQAQEIGKAYSVMSSVPEDKISETFDRMPEANKKALFDEVGGVEAWNKFSNAEKKEVTKNLMLNASKKLATQQRILDQEKQEVINDGRREVAIIRENGAIARKTMGSGSAADDKNWSRYEVRVENLRKGNDRAVTAINKQIEEAEAAAAKSVHWYSIGDTKQETKYKELVAKRDKMQRDDLQEELDLTLEAPNFPGKDRAIKRLEQAISTFGTDEPTVKSKDVPSNKTTTSGQVEKGNIDLTKRPVVKNKDGSISTVRSMSFEEDGKEVLIPTVVGDKVVSEKEAVAHYRKTGEHLGKFDSPKAADAYAKKLHEDQDKMYSGTKTAPMSMPKSANDAVDGKYYNTKAGVLKWDKKTKTFVE